MLEDSTLLEDPTILEDSHDVIEDSKLFNDSKLLNDSKLFKDSKRWMTSNVKTPNVGRPQDVKDSKMSGHSKCRKYLLQILISEIY